MQILITLLAAYRSPVLAVTGLYWPLSRLASVPLPFHLRLDDFDTALLVNGPAY